MTWTQLEGFSCCMLCLLCQRKATDLICVCVCVCLCGWCVVIKLLQEPSEQLDLQLIIVFMLVHPLITFLINPSNCMMSENCQEYSVLTSKQILFKWLIFYLKEKKRRTCLECKRWNRRLFLVFLLYKKQLKWLISYFNCFSSQKKQSNINLHQHISVF